jgi:hypothetical protein
MQILAAITIIAVAFAGKVDAYPCLIVDRHI